MYGGESQLAVATEGAVIEGGIPSGIALLDPYNGSWHWLVNNWFGLHLIGVNDLVALDDGSLIFTTINSLTSLVPELAPQVGFAVWILPPAGPLRVLLDDFVPAPNGLALSRDQRTLYVSTFAVHDTPEDQIAGNKIYAFDLVQISGGWFAVNRRLFAALDIGFADNFKVDASGHLYASAGDGVQVFSPAGQLIGKVLLPKTSKTKQATSAVAVLEDKLIILRNTAVIVLEMSITPGN